MTKHIHTSKNIKTEQQDFPYHTTKMNIAENDGIMRQSHCGGNQVIDSRSLSDRIRDLFKEAQRTTALPSPGQNTVGRAIEINGQ